MVEKYTVVDKLRLTYEGIFNISELYKLIDNLQRARWYDKNDLRNIEKVRPEGKYVEIEMYPWRKISDYARSRIRMRFIMTDIKDVEVERDGVKAKMQQGRIHAVFDGYLETDYENRWEQKPIFYFLRGVVDKFIYAHYTEGYKSIVKDDVNHFYSQIKAFLNLYRYSDTPISAPAYHAEDRP